jgi:hypothetical protein
VDALLLVFPQVQPAWRRRSGSFSPGAASRCITQLFANVNRKAQPVLRKSGFVVETLQQLVVRGGRSGKRADAKGSACSSLLDK